MVDRSSLDDWLGRSDTVVKESISLAEALRGTPARAKHKVSGIIIEFPQWGNVEYLNPGEDTLPWCEDCAIGALHALEDCTALVSQ